VLDTHTHEFDAKALVVAGEMWLTVCDRTEHIAAGGTFEIDAGTPHSERYGSEGATYWVARRTRR
jgi:quercetin dioxygenase-like cupin family protein